MLSAVIDGLLVAIFGEWYTRRRDTDRKARAHARRAKSRQARRFAKRQQRKQRRRER